MLLKSLHLKNILSFSEAEVDLKPLNIFIGPNASGKSNVIETVALLQSIPGDLAGFFRRNGPILDWIWRGANQDGEISSTAHVEALIRNPMNLSMSLRYTLQLAANNERLQVVRERLENERPHWPHPRPYYYFELDNGYGRISAQRAADSTTRHSDEADGADTPQTNLTPDDIDPGKSIMSERRDPVNFPVPTQTARRFSSMRLYRTWNVGRDSPARRPQATDGAIDFLEEDFSNLALVVNDLQGRRLDPPIDNYLNRFYEAYDGLHARVFGGTIQLAANEVGMSGSIPATRLSDGTIRFIALLTILGHPNPPELICIEEPELALHPDALSLLAELLRAASQRTQVIVTTHSPELINHFTDEPEVVVVCERGPDGGTQFRRLSRDDLESWMGEYRLGEVWMSGATGGTRW